MFITQPVLLSPLPSTLLTSLCSVCPGCSEVPDTPNRPTSGLLTTFLPYATVVTVIVFVVGVGTRHSVCKYTLRALTHQVASMNMELGRKAMEKLGLLQNCPGHSSLLPHNKVQQESCSMTIPAQHGGLDGSVILRLSVPSVVLGITWSVSTSSVQITSGNKCWLCSVLYHPCLRCWRAQETPASS